MLLFGQKLHILSFDEFSVVSNNFIAQSAGDVEYTDCTSAEG